jgi:hypothetical protein
MKFLPSTLFSVLLLGSASAQNFNYNAAPSAEATDRCAIINLAVDESGSMFGEHQFLRDTALPRMAQTLYSDRYQFDHVFVCSVGFGFIEVNEETGGGDLDFINEVNRRGRRKLTNLEIADEDFHGFHLGCTTANADGTLNNNGVTDWLVSDEEGESEDGYAAVIRAIQDVPSEIDNINLLSSCKTLAKNVILVTDEDRDELVASATADAVRGKVEETGYILNEVVSVNIRDGDIGVRFDYPIRPIDAQIENNQFLDSAPPIDYEGAKNEFFVATPGGGWTTEIVYDDWRNLVQNGDGQTKEDYGPLVQDTRGALWSIKVLRDAKIAGKEDLANSFADAFVAIKVDEMTCVGDECDCQNPPCRNTETGGDPHFLTWTKEHYEYHGQCDLVLVSDPKFAEGKGLDVHIRTKMVRFWSYIKSVAIRIGDDILEIEGSADKNDAEPHYWINFQYQGQLDTFAGYPVTQKAPSAYKRRYIIDLGDGEHIIVQLYKEFVRVKFFGGESTFGNTVGLMGDYKTGKTLARDGSTVMDDFIELGNEWQVNPADGEMLFHDVSKPQFPEPCLIPEDPRGARRRQLSESTITVEQAEAACASLGDELTIKDCVYDILATQDMDMVGAF